MYNYIHQSMMMIQSYRRSKIMTVNQRQNTCTHPGREPGIRKEVVYFPVLERW